jgi:hypothetical protein
MMDNDDGGVLSRYSDSLCVLDFLNDSKATMMPEDGGSFSPQSNTYSVIGKGESDFGTFILQGVYNSASRDLDVTRKYVSSFDPRSSMSISQIREALTASPLVFPTLSPSNAPLTEAATSSPVSNTTSDFNSTHPEM